MASARRARNEDPKRTGALAPEVDPDVEAKIRLALATWSEIDPDVEGIVTRIAQAAGYLDRAARASLSRVGLTKEEFKVLCALHTGMRSHGSLCHQLGVSTGAMTNRLDKLERADLVARSRDPNDRRGVLLELTPLGREKLDQYINAGATRERELLAALSKADKQRLNRLLQTLIESLQSELDGS